MAGTAVIGGAPDVARVILLVAALVMLALAESFRHLTVTDEMDRLVIRYGPLPLFRKTVPYNQIAGVEVGRTTFLDGWGIHYSLRGGWVYNLWGTDCVVLTLRRGKLFVGTDDPEGLAAFLRERIAET